jgi:hypothetical protein
MQVQEVDSNASDEVVALRALAHSRRAYAFARYLERHQKGEREVEEPERKIPILEKELQTQARLRRR